MRKYLFIFLFLLVVLLGTALRFWQLGKVPDSLDWDEVATGYNAYSILIAGKDEYGQFLPLTFKSFGDYKPPLYIYLTIPAVKVFGLTPFAVRFPSALFGSLSIFFVFQLTWNMFSTVKYKKWLALLASFFFALSPWSIQFSRGAFEANVALFFVIAGAALLVASINRRSNAFAIIGSILLAGSTYGYHSEKLFSPLLFVGICIWGREFFFKKRTLLSLCILAFVFVCSFWILDRSSLARGSSITFAGDSKTLQASIVEIDQDKARKDNFDALLHNRRFVFLETFASNYLSHFQPNWLFISGDLERHHAPGVAMIYLFSLPTILLGLYFFSRRFFRKSWILLFWFLSAPISASLVIQAPHAIRSLVFLPTWQIFEALGWYAVLFVMKGKTRIIVTFVLGALLLINSLYYFHQYFVHTNTDYEQFWQYGYAETMEYANNQKQGRTYIDDNIEQGYIFYLFYNKIDPKLYLSNGGSNNMNNKCFAINSVVFHACKPMGTGDRVITLYPLSKSHLREIKTIRYTNGKTAVRIYQER